MDPIFQSPIQRTLYDTARTQPAKHYIGTGRIIAINPHSNRAMVDIIDSISGGIQTIYDVPIPDMTNGVKTYCYVAGMYVVLGFIDGNIMFPYIMNTYPPQYVPSIESLFGSEVPESLPET